MDHLACLTPEAFAASPQAFDGCRWRLLAQGDTWFSYSAARLNAHANLLQELVFKERVGAVNCAGSSNVLAHMVDLESSPAFVKLLTGAGAPVWDGVLLSVGGNDLIEAAATPAHLPDGSEVPLEKRLLRRQTEWGPPSAGVARYFSEPGWETLAAYLRANILHLVTLRDRGPSAGKPMFLHCYAHPMPRPAGGDDGSGPWLFPAFKAYAIPAADWPAVSRLMVQRMVAAYKAMAADTEHFPALKVFDTTTVPLAPSTPGTTGISGDWHNEIHLNHSGCFKLGRAWSEAIETVLIGAPLKPEKKGRGG
ncbi:MAG TPA: hypothetical protein VGE47_01410 [Burkholderiaceae bacterium]